MENVSIQPHCTSKEVAFQKYKISELRAFAIMPFDRVRGRVYKLAIEPACKAKNFYCIRADCVYRPGRLIDNITSCIEMATVIFADISGNNPNVLYEAGISKNCGKSIIFIIDTKGKIPSDLQGERYIRYESSAVHDMEILRMQLECAILEKLLDCTKQEFSRQDVDPVSRYYEER